MFMPEFLIRLHGSDIGFADLLKEGAKITAVSSDTTLGELTDKIDAVKKCDATQYRAELHRLIESAIPRHIAVLTSGSAPSLDSPKPIPALLGSVPLEELNKAVAKEFDKYLVSDLASDDLDTTIQTSIQRLIARMCIDV